MQIYDAIMKAAHYIELNPQQWKFRNIQIPMNECGTSGCALGWIGYFLGMERGSVVAYVARALTGHKTDCGGIFYQQLAEFGCDVFVDKPATVAAALRRYAAKYHASEKPHFTGLPDIVRDIFTNPRQTISTEAADSLR
jgi:hypothetical protein